MADINQAPAFPDKSTLPKSDISDEYIRGGSIGLNRILARFEQLDSEGKEINLFGILINAFTIVRNVMGTGAVESPQDIETGVVKDLTLLLDYYNTYLARSWSRSYGQRKCPVIVYFPDYRHIHKDLRRSWSPTSQLIWDCYKQFSATHGQKPETLRELSHSLCLTTIVGRTSLPYVDIRRGLRELLSHSWCLPTSNDRFAMVSHILLDMHLSRTMPNLVSLESHTGKIIPSQDFRFKLDDQGRVPFNPTTHMAFGDKVMIKPMVSGKLKNVLLEDADHHHWLTKTEVEIQKRISELTKIPAKQFDAWSLG